MSKTAYEIKTQLTSLGVRQLKVIAIANSPITRTYSAESTYTKAVGYLKYLNSSGHGIHMVPEADHSIFVLDDVDQGKINSMREQLIDPCCIVETSEGNYQSWFRLKAGEQRYKAELMQRYLCAAFHTDKGAIGLEHPGAIAGFRNTKSSIDNPFWCSVYYANSNSIVSFDEFETVIYQWITGKDGRQIRERIIEDLGINDFRQSEQFDGDLHRADMAYCHYARKSGVKKSEAYKALLTRDLRHKGSEKRQQDYIERTLRKAGYGSN